MVKCFVSHDIEESPNTIKWRGREKASHQGTPACQIEVRLQDISRGRYNYASFRGTATRHIEVRLHDI